MYEVDNPLFIGIKISPKLQSELDNCAPGTEHYFKQHAFAAVTAFNLQANDSGGTIWTRGK